MNKTNNNDSAIEIIAQVLQEQKYAQGDAFSYSKVNLAELERLTGLSRQRLRTLKKHQFMEVSHGNTGKDNHRSVLHGYTSTLDELLINGVSNSNVCFERLREKGYTGSQSTVKRYIKKHSDLIPAKRKAVAPQGSRGRRYQTGPGETFQMDWGFSNVTAHDGSVSKIACFAMICHHCGMRYIEFFPNAKQENLFIGMLNAFVFMGIPSFVLTDNMKSVVIKRDVEGHPIWQKDYESFMRTVGFRTKLCKPRHPFTKGKVERLIRFVKDNFLAGRTFGTITDLNIEAIEWCQNKNYEYQDAVWGIPIQIHNSDCAKVLNTLDETPELLSYYCPERRISFDGFVNYEGRRYGVPYRYHGRTVRVRRKGFYLYIYSSDFSELLVTHDVTWSRRDRFCVDQYTDDQPEELPTAPVRVMITENQSLSDTAFSKFDFDKEDLSYD